MYSEILNYKVSDGKQSVSIDEATDEIGQDYQNYDIDHEYAYIDSKECVSLL